MKDHVEKVRRIIADFPDVNYAAQKEVFSDQEIEEALKRALEHFNQRPPIPTNFSTQNMPYLYAWYMAAIQELYRKLALEEVDVPNLDGGVSSVPRTELLEAVANAYAARSEMLFDALKYQINLFAGYGKDPRAPFPSKLYWWW